MTVVHQQLSNHVRRTIPGTTRIEELCLSIRTYNRLRYRVSTVGELARITPQKLLAITGFGKKCLIEVASILEDFYSSLNPYEIAGYSAEVFKWMRYFDSPRRIPTPLERPGDLGSVPAPSEVDNEGPKVQQIAWNPDSFPQAQIQIEDLPLSVRARNVLVRKGVKNLHDLALTDPEKFRSLSNCGRKTRIEISAVVKQYLDSLPAIGRTYYGMAATEWLRWIPDIKSRLGITTTEDGGKGFHTAMPLLPSTNCSVMEVVASFLGSLEDRRRSIVTKRMGLPIGENRRTLEAVGREFGLTRERVRQIVMQSLKSFARIIRTSRPDVYPTVIAYLEDAGIAPLDELSAVIKNPGDSDKYSFRACVRMLLLAGPENIHHLGTSGQLWGSSKDVTPKLYSRVLRAAQKVLRGIPLEGNQVSLEVAKSLHQFEDHQIRLIQKMLRNPSGLLKIELLPDGEILLHPPYQNLQEQRKAFAYNYIKEQGVPVHVQEIFSAMQDFEPELIPDSPGRRSASYALAACLDRDDRFAWAGSSTWGLREWGYPSHAGSIGAAALELLRAANRPLSIAEIRQSMNQLYRVNPASIYAALKASEGDTVKRDLSGRWCPV